jgi:hypothetical protein
MPKGTTPQALAGPRMLDLAAARHGVVASELDAPRAEGVL